MNLTEINNAQLSHLALQTKIAFFRAIADVSLDCNKIMAFVTHVNDPELNLVMDTQHHEMGLEEKIIEVIDFFQRHHKKDWQKDWAWIVGSLSKPSHLTSVLQQHGFTETEKYPGMYFDLSEELSDIKLTDFVIEETPYNDPLKAWIIPVAEAFEFTDPNDAEDYRQAHAKITHGIGTIFRHYIGFYRQEPVCAGTLFIHQDSVVIRNVTTRPQFIRRGFGSTLTTHALKEAQKLGIKHCFLDASTDGEALYRKMGFKTYCTYSAWMR